MPLFEYRCSECKAKFEVLHKSSVNQEDVFCPVCNSSKNKKLFSSFSASVGNSSAESFNNCASGNCSIPETSYGSGCSNGMCGLN